MNCSYGRKSASSHRIASNLHNIMEQQFCLGPSVTSSGYNLLRNATVSICRNILESGLVQFSEIARLLFFLRELREFRLKSRYFNHFILSFVWLERMVRQDGEESADL